MKEKDFDALLDGILRKDAAAEPREGFEARMLARVQAEARVERGSAAMWWSRWRGRLLAPACAGLIAVVWFGSARRVRESDKAALRMAPSIASVQPVEKTEAAGSHGVTTPELNVGRGGRASREAHLSDDKAVAKMGHPVHLVLVAQKERRLPKLDVFPSPAPADVFLTPARESKEDRALAAVSNSQEALAAWASLKKQQAEPVRIAAIQIPPLAEVQ